jgi:hypothetical protein
MITFRARPLAKRDKEDRESPSGFLHPLTDGLYNLEF